MNDIPRMASYWNITLSWPPEFKPQSTRAMCLATALNSSGAIEEAFIDTALKLLWVEKHDLESPETFAKLVELAGLGSFDEKSALSDLTKNSVEAFHAGVFGVPTFKVDKEIIFGADRMEMLASRFGIIAA